MEQSLCDRFSIYIEKGAKEFEDLLPQLKGKATEADYDRTKGICEALNSMPSNLRSDSFYRELIQKIIWVHGIRIRDIAEESYKGTETYNIFLTAKGMLDEIVNMMIKASPKN